MSAARVLPLLASINGSEGGMLLAAAQNVEAVPSVSRQAQLRTEAARARFSFVHAAMSMAESWLTNCTDQGAGIRDTVSLHVALTVSMT